MILRPFVSAFVGSIARRTLFAVAFFAAPSLAQPESGMPVLIGQPGVPAPRFEGRTDASAFPQWWYIHHELVLDLRRTVMGGVDPQRGFRRVLESDYERVMIALEAAQADANPGVRAAAALALSKAQDRRGTALHFKEPAEGIPAPLFDANVDVRRAAILGLGVGADPAALDTLKDILTGEKWEPALRATAALAIGLIEVPVTTGSAASPVPEDVGPSIELPLTAELESGSIDGATSLAFDPSGERFVFGFEDGSLAVWSTKSKKLGKSWKVHAGPVRGLAFLGDNDRVASAGVDGSVRVFSLKLGKELWKLDGFGAIDAFAVDASSERIGIGGASFVAVVPASGRKDFVHRFEAKGAVVGVSFLGESGAIVVATRTGEITAFGPNESDPSRSIAAVGEPTLAVASCGKGGSVVFGGESGTVRCLTAVDAGAVRWTRELGAPIQSIVVSPCDRHCAVLTATGAFHLLSVETGASEAALDVAARGVAFDSSGERVAFALNDGSARRCDLKSGGTVSPAPPGGGAPLVDPTVLARRATVLSSVLEPKTFVALDPMVQDGVALGAGLTGDVALAKSLEELLEVGSHQSVSGATLGYIAIAYGRMVVAGGGSLETLVRHATKADSAEVRRGAVLGLGAVLENTGGKGHESIVHSLITRVTMSSGESDRRVKNAISLTLGRIGGAKAERFLVDELNGAESGGGTIARNPPKIGIDELDAAPLQAVALASMKSTAGYKVTGRRYDKEGAIHLRGALAISLGMHGVNSAGSNDDLLKDLKKEKNPVLVAHLALALGLARANAAAGALESRLSDPKTDASILPQLAVARSMLDVPGATKTPALVASRLSKAKSTSERAALAFGLGLMGDSSAVEPLLSLLHDDTTPAEVRAAAVAALGELLDPGPFRRLPEALAKLDGIEDPRILRALAGN